MTRKTTTVMLETSERDGDSAHIIEVALRAVPGVSRAYVNQDTEVAYVEYDDDRCDSADLEHAVESVGVHTFHVATEPPVTDAPFPLPSGRLPMDDTTNTRSRTWWAFAGFTAIAGFFLFTEHRAHLYGILPFVFLLACPFLHMFGHGGHGGHDSDAQGSNGDHRDHAGAAGDSGQSSGGHPHSTGATRDDWRS